MSTATEQQATEHQDIEQQAVAPSTDVGIWGADVDGNQISIPVVGVTGAYQSGKTLFGLGIAPGGNRTRCYDFELSASGYKGLKFEHVDVNAEMRKLFAQKPYKPIDMFRWWQSDIMRIPMGKYAVIMVDPATDIESGLVDYVASRYADYGFGSESKFVSTGGIFWKYVQEHWKRLLADLASRCETFVFTSHLRKIWIGGKATRNQEPKGKSTLLELSSLYLWLDRSADDEGKVPEKPRCHKKLKDRLSYTAIDPETMEPIVQPYLPPAFDECTPKKIREYFKKPANYKRLKANERVQQETMTEEERLDLERQIAESKAEAEASALQRLDRQAELQRMQQEAEARQPQPVDASSEVNAAKQQKDEASQDEASQAQEQPPFEPDSEPVGNGKVTPAQVSRIVELKDQLGLDLDRFQKGVARHTGGSTNPMDLTAEQGDEIIAKLEQALAKKS